MLFLKQGSHMRRCNIDCGVNYSSLYFLLFVPHLPIVVPHQIIEKALSQMNLLFMWVAKIRRLSILSKVAE